MYVGDYEVLAHIPGWRGLRLGAKGAYWDGAVWREEKGGIPVVPDWVAWRGMVPHSDQSGPYPS